MAKGPKSKTKPHPEAAVTETTKPVKEAKKVLSAEEQMDVPLKGGKHNGDAVAIAMEGLSINDLIKVCADNNIADKVGPFEKYGNPGRFKMMTGNSLRSLARKGTVKIKGKKVTLVEETATA